MVGLKAKSLVANWAACLDAKKVVPRAARLELMRAANSASTWAACLAALMVE